MSRRSWSTVKLGALCEITSGFPFKSDKFSDDPDDVALVKGENVGQGRVLWEISRRWSRNDIEGLDRFRLVGGDVVLAMDRPWVPAGLKFARIPESAPEALLVQRVARLRARDELRQDFLACLIGSSHFVAYIQNIARGVGVPHISGKEIAAFEFEMPTDRQQAKIASILIAYDDLLENNRRRMALLEESARLMYREWFVHLRFPGHESTRVVDGLPVGWERKRLAELCDSVDYGYTASASDEEVGPKFLRITDIVPQVIDWSSVPYCPIEEKRFAKFRLEQGDIVIARTGATVGYAKRMNKLHPESVFASYLVRMRLKPEVDDLFVGIFVESDDYKSFVKSRVGGAAQPNASAPVLTGAEMLIPTCDLQRAFRHLVEPLVDQRELLQIQNQKLKTARDLLLPKLMSGEIAV